jgi:FkbM family methyltransferase
VASDLRICVAPRNPFRIVALPLLLRLQLDAEARNDRLRAKLAKSLFSLAHRRLGRPAWGRMRVGETEVRIDAANTHYLALLRAGAAGYEPETAALLDALVPDDGVFFDVGANWGPFSLLVASRPGFVGKVVAFEPIARVRADLAAVVAQAGLASRIAVRGEALSDRAGQGAMRYKLHSALATLQPGEGGVIMARLDDLALPAPHVIKIDVEGHEHAVLEGARRVIAAHRPMIVLESWHRTDDPALAWLEGERYRLFRPALGETVLTLHQFSAAARGGIPGDINVFACPAEKIDTLR